MNSDPGCTVYELRQYTLHPNVRDTFVSLFDAELLEPQDAAGMPVLGQFRDLDRPDVFVWIRGFANMTTRHRALHAFYDGPVWAAHRDAANAMMLDSDDVLLLEPAEPSRALDRHADIGTRKSANATTSPAPTTTVLVAEICPLPPDNVDEYLHRWRISVAPLLRDGGSRPLPPLRTLHAVNTFPRLPVRDDICAALTITAFADRTAAEALLADPSYQAQAADLNQLASAPPQRLWLAPTTRSALR
jgi:hypothetical protein